MPRVLIPVSRTAPDATTERVVECWSEHGALDRVAVFRPADLDVATPEEAAALGFCGTVTRAEAEDAAGCLREALKSAGCNVVELRELLPERDRAVSDTTVNRVFVRDTAAVLGRQIVTGVAAFPARLAEFDMARTILTQLMAAQPSLPHPPSPLSAAEVEFGDVFLLDDERVLVNFGLRSNARFIRSFVELVWSLGFREVAAIQIPESLNIIHLDLAFNVLGARAVVARPFLRHYPLRVFEAGQEQRWEAFEGYFASRGRRVLAFNPQGANDFLSNYIHLNPRLILASASTAARLRLLVRDFGIEVVSVDIEALERGNGSVRCLTLPLQRRTT
jgi:arginine deiminase